MRLARSGKRNSSDREVAPKGYSRTQVALHWIIAALILVQLVFNDPIQDAFDDRVDGDRMDEFGGALVHILVGTTVLVLGIFRLALRFIRGAPEPHDDKPWILNWVGSGTHAALYVFIFALPVTGLLAWIGSWEEIAEIHEIGRLILIPLIGFHILGALAEHFVFRNDGLMRMLRPQRVGSQSGTR
jgi:cytochrome b561